MPAAASTSPIHSDQFVTGLAMRRKRAGLASACMMPGLGPPDQPLRHGVGDRGWIASGLRAFFPDLLESDRDAFDPPADQRCVAVAEIFGADVDDTAGIDDVIGRVEDAALLEALAIARGGQLVVGA